MPYRPITNSADSLLTVYVDRANPDAPVMYSYGDAHQYEAPRCTADLPDSDEDAWWDVEAEVTK